MRDLLRLTAGAALSWHLTRRALHRRRAVPIPPDLFEGPTSAEIILAREAPLVAAVEARHAELQPLADAFTRVAHNLEIARNGAWPVTVHLAPDQTRSGTITEGPVEHLEWRDPERPFDPVDLTPYIAHVQRFVVGIDQAESRVGEHQLEHIPDGCWRTVSAHDGYTPCNRPPVDDVLGLCVEHTAELQETAP